MELAALALTEVEESFFAAGDAMSAVPEVIESDLSGIPEEIIDERSNTRPYDRAPELIGYYASLAIESDVISGFFEAAA